MEEVDQASTIPLQLGDAILYCKKTVHPSCIIIINNNNDPPMTLYHNRKVYHTSSPPTPITTQRIINQNIHEILPLISSPPNHDVIVSLSDGLYNLDRKSVV